MYVCMDVCFFVCFAVLVILYGVVGCRVGRCRSGGGDKWLVR